MSKPTTSSVRRDPFVLVPQFFGSIVFDRSTSKYLPFDQESTRLLLRLRSESFDCILAREADTGARHQLIRFFEDFHRLGFFSWDGKFMGSALEMQPPADHLTGPLAVHLEVVAACNLTCTHCFAGTLPRREHALTIHELDDLFRTLAGMGAFRLGLTGGEPLLRRDIFEIIDLAIDHGLHPCVTTNGLLITEQIAREFGKRELVWLNVSLEGATPQTNDPIRGAGTFARVLENLPMLARHSRFTLAFTIMRTNLGEIERCAELAYHVGAHTAVFRPLYPVGTARQNLNLMPTFHEYNEALNRLAGIKDEPQFEFCTLDPFSPQARADAHAVTHQNHGCGAGNHVCSISISGDVNPCSFLGPEFVAANLRQRPFPDIWHRSQGFQEMRALPGPSGTEGGKDETFCGGCRARALVYNGSVNAPDPWISDRVAVSACSPGADIDARCLHHPLVTLEITKQC
jgi:mycofactocin biosynthetic radical S-adenosylmethionine protein MftC